MKKNIGIIFSLMLLTGLAFSAENFSKVNKELPFSKGINLPQWLEYNRSNTMLYGKKDFENIKAMGVEVIRLPVWFEIWNDGAPDYKISQDCFINLDDAVSWCKELGMYLIIDFHNDCDGASKTDPNIEKVLMKVWPQIAERYKNQGEYVIYEIMNEPHFKSGNISADIKKWGDIQGKVLTAIRQIDKNHYVIVGGADWNSVDSMLKLPNYTDDKVIYNFHDYTPFLFTHQGAEWTDLKRITGIPFPYAKEKMPKLPKNPTNSEKWNYDNYRNDSSEKTLVAPLNKAVEFVNKRNASLMCNEFGVSMVYADPAERANWYRLKTDWMAERNITHVSWDYTQSFGVFKSPSEIRFPEDLNKAVVEAMGFTVPAGKSTSWFEAAKKTGDYTIFQNGLAANLHAGVYYGNSKESIVKIDKTTNEKILEFREIEANRDFPIYFSEICDFTDLKDSGAKLEFFARKNDKKGSFLVYFRNSESKCFPWRAGLLLNSGIVAADGKWHKLSIPLKDFVDFGGWSSAEGWKDGCGQFDWTSIGCIVFQNYSNYSKEGYAIKDVKIVK